MSISRDEAREIAIIGLLATAAIRAGAGVVKVIEELTGEWTFRSLLSQLFAPIGSTIGMLILGAVLVAVLSPTGSITPITLAVTKRAAEIVAVLGLAAAFNTLVLSYSTLLGKIWIAMINGLATTVLAGTAWWIISNFDPER